MAVRTCADLGASDVNLRVRSWALGSRVKVVLGFGAFEYESKVVLVKEIATRRRSH